MYRFAGERLAEAWLVPLDPVHFDRIWTALDRDRPPPAAPDGRPQPLPGAALTQAGEMVSETLALGSVVIARHHVPAGFDSAPLYRMLPGGMCPCEHLCLLEAGALSYRFETGERHFLDAGEATRVAGGHLADVLEDARLIELTALEEYRVKSEALARSPAA